MNDILVAIGDHPFAFIGLVLGLYVVLEGLGSAIRGIRK